MKSKAPKKKISQPAPLVDWQASLQLLSENWQRLRMLHHRQRLPQVLLLTGVRQADLTNVALALGAAYFCETEQGCGQCSRCLAVLHGTEPDLLVVSTTENSLKIADVEIIQEFLQSMPSAQNGKAMGKRVCILLECEKWTLQAVNRLLKILEEPPASAQIILTSSLRRRLLPTLLSRCVQWVLHYPADYLQKQNQGHANQDEQAAMNSLLTGGDDLGAQLRLLEPLARGVWKDLGQFLQRAEGQLNLIYRQQFLPANKAKSITGIRRNLTLQRLRLRRLKELALRKKIALNSQLSIESLTLE